MALGRVLRRCALGEDAEVLTRRLEFSDPRLDIDQATGDEVAHVLAGRSTGIADVEDLPDLVEREPGGLGVTDEDEALDGAPPIEPVARRGAAPLRQGVLLLPVADRLPRPTHPPRG